MASIPLTEEAWLVPALMENSEGRLEDSFVMLRLMGFEVNGLFEHDNDFYVVEKSSNGSILCLDKERGRVVIKDKMGQVWFRERGPVLANK